MIQGFKVLSLFPVFRYLARRFKFKETSIIRKGYEVYDLEFGDVVDYRDYL